MAEVNKLAPINGAADAEELRSVIEREFEVTAFIDLMPKERREELAGIILRGIEDEGRSTLPQLSSLQTLRPEWQNTGQQ